MACCTGLLSFLLFLSLSFPFSLPHLSLPSLLFSFFWFTLLVHSRPLPFTGMSRLSFSKPVALPPLSLFFSFLQACSLSSLFLRCLTPLLLAFFSFPFFLFFLSSFSLLFLFFAFFAHFFPSFLLLASFHFAPLVPLLREDKERKREIIFNKANNARAREI